MKYSKTSLVFDWYLFHFHGVMGAYDYAWNVGNYYFIDKSVNRGRPNIDRSAEISAIDVQIDHQSG